MELNITFKGIAGGQGQPEFRDVLRFIRKLTEVASVPGIGMTTASINAGDDYNVRFEGDPDALVNFLSGKFKQQSAWEDKGVGEDELVHPGPVRYVHINMAQLKADDLKP